MLRLMEVEPIVKSNATAINGRPTTIPAPVNEVARPELDKTVEAAPIPEQSI